MSHESSPEFRTFHALRVKGFAAVDVLMEMTGHGQADVDAHLADRADRGHAQFREARSLWQLTPGGREVHAEELAVDLDGVDIEAVLGELYPTFIHHNVAFKELCGEWQLRDGAPNDHSDPDYDAEVIGRLADLHSESHPVVMAMGGSMARLVPYASRLEQALDLVHGGDRTKFTGVMCGSYHDVWMELHEDLILTQGIDRAAEGSF
ncbi:MAG: MarR family transcriptional regulator [Actinomycetota bacterium]